MNVDPIPWLESSLPLSKQNESTETDPNYQGVLDGSYRSLHGWAPRRWELPLPWPASQNKARPRQHEGFKHIIIENDVPVYWLLLVQPTLSGPAAQGDSQERCIQHIEEMPCFGPFNAATKLHHLPRQKTEPSMMSLQLFYTTLEIIRGFHQSRTGACRQEPGPIQRKAIPKRIVINVGQAK